VNTHFYTVSCHVHDRHIGQIRAICASTGDATAPRGTAVDEIRTSQPTPDDVLDDVEGHGLREVAVGVSAAAVLGTGGIAAASMHSAGHLMGPGAQSVASDTSHLAGHTAHGAGDIAGTTASDAGQLGSDSASTAHDVADPTVSRTAVVSRRLLDIAGTEVADAGRLASNAVTGAVGLTDAVATGAVGMTEQEVARATTTVKTTENTATSAVGRAEGSAVKTADGAISTVNKTTIKVIKVARTVAGDWSMNVSVLGATIDGSGPSPLSTHPEGTIRLTDATGHLLASATLHNGAATLQFQGVTAHQTLTLHYPGSSSSASTTHYTL